MAANLGAQSGAQSGIEGTGVADQLRTMVSSVSRMLKYGQVQVQAKLGDFENEEQNCLLVFWDMQRLYKITDKNKILHSAGNTVTQKWKEHRNGHQFQKRVILVTPGDNLKYIKIIHVASDIDSIHKDAKDGLMKAESEEMKTLVVPINDGDPCHRDVNKFCTGILRAIKELATEFKFVESVTLVIQRKPTFSFFHDIFIQESRQYGTGKKPVKNGSVDETWEFIDRDEIPLEENKSVTLDDLSKSEKGQHEISPQIQIFVSSPQIQNKSFVSEGLVDKRNSSESQIRNIFSAPLEQIQNRADADHLPGLNLVETTEGKNGKRHTAAEIVSGQTPAGKAANNDKTKSSLLSSVEEINQIGSGEKHEEPDHISCMQETKNDIDQKSNVIPLEKHVSSDEGCPGSVSLCDQPLDDIKYSSDGKSRVEGPTTDPAVIAKMRVCQESDENEPSPDPQVQITPQSPLRKKQAHSSNSVAEKSKQLDWRCNEGNTQVIKLLITYLKKQGGKNEFDFSKHLVPCSRNFQLMWNFYTKTDCGKKMLDVIALKHHCKVSLSAIDQFKEFFIFQVSESEFQEESDVKNFVDGVIDSVYICAQESLSIDSIEFDHRVQDDFREKLKERKELDCAWIELVSESKPATIYTVSLKEHQQPVVQIITEVIKYATESFNSHREMVTADCMWQKVMTSFEYLFEMGSKFPNAVIIQDENLNAFLLKGPRDEVKAAAGQLEELLKMAHKEIHEEVFSPGYQFEIFGCPEMCKYIEECIPKLSVVWMPNHLTKKIHLFSRDPGQFKGIEKSIKGCVKEILYPLSKDYSKLPSEMIYSLEELKKIYKGQIVIHPSDTHTGLLVTVADEIFTSVHDAVSKIVSTGTDEVHPETPVPEEHDGKSGHPGCIPELSTSNPDIKMTDFPLKKVLVSDKNVTKTFEVKDKILFRKFCKEYLAELKQVAEEHCVSLHQLESEGSRVAFELKGPEKEVQHIYEYLTERTQRQQMQLQNDNRGMAASTEKAEQAPSPCTKEMSEDSKVSGCTESSVGLLSIAVDNTASQEADQDVYPMKMDALWQVALDKFGYLSEIYEMFPAVTLVLDKTTDLCVIKGPMQKIKTVVDRLTNLLHTVQHDIVEKKFSPCKQFEIMICSEMQQYIERKIALDLNQIKYAWVQNFETNEVHVLTENKENCERIGVVINSCISEVEIQLPAQTDYEQKTKLVEKSLSSHEGKIWIKHENSNVFCLTTADDIFDSVKDELQANIQKYFSKKSTEKSMENRSLTHASGASKDGATARRPSDRLLEMTDPIKKSIITEKYSAFSASEVSYLASGEGRQILSRLEEEYNCTIKITNPLIVTGVEESCPHEGTMGPYRMVTYIYPHNNCVILFNAKVEKCKTDVIVTPYLTPFSSTGQQKLPFILKQSTNLNMYIPLCNETNSNAKNILIENICATLRYSEDKQHGKVGFAISPIGGWDLTKFVKLFLYAISDFFIKSRETSVKKVHLCTDDLQIFAKMKGAAVDFFQSLITSHNKAGDTYMVNNDAVPGTKSAVQPSNPVLQFNKIEIRVEVGELSQIEADVIVNTTSTNLELSHGAISKSLLKAAGQKIQEECKKAYPKGISEGKVARTTGGDIKCKEIFHGALKSHSEMDWGKILKKFINACLTQASHSKYKSIAFPALGTGNLGLPRDDVAHTMFNCVKEFSCKKELSLRKVMFVIYNKDENTLKVFQDFFLKFKDAEKGKMAFEIEVTGLKDKVKEVIMSIQQELKKLTSEDLQAREKKLGKSKRAIASSISEPLPQGILPEERGASSEGAAMEQKHSGTSVNMPSIELEHTSQDRCCIIVSGDIKSREDLEKRFSSYNHDSNKLKYVVYPYENKTALVIFEKEVDIKTLELDTDPLRVEPLPPQVLLELEFLLPDSLVERAQRIGQSETLFTKLTETAGVHISFKDHQVYLYGVTAHQMDIAREYLEEFCEERLNIKIKKSSKGLCSSTVNEDSFSSFDVLKKVSKVEYKALEIIENGFEKMQKAQLSWDGDAILIHGHAAYVDYIKTELSSQLKALRNKQCEEISLDEDEMKVLDGFIAEVHSKDTICILDEKKTQVVVYSDKQEDIMKFKHKLKLKTGKVKESGRNRKRFADNTKSMEASWGEFRSEEMRQEFSWSKNSSDVEVFYTKENIKVAVYKADILNLPVDCIVNAANDNLQHGGGVAKVIADAAGPELVQDGDAIIRETGSITVGSQVITVAGRLPYKCVIHTVGPNWLDYKPHNFQKVKDCEEDLYRAIYGCFTEAERSGLSTIALPAVSSGIYAVPQDMCAVQYARAVIDYSRKSIPGKFLKEIHFIDKLPHLVKLMQDTFRTMIQNGNIPNYNIQNYVVSSSGYQRQQSMGTGWKVHGKQDIAVNKSQYETSKPKELSPVYYELTEHHKKHFVFQVSTKPVVHIYEGNILTLKNIDAVVCPDNTRGTGIGLIASELLKRPKYKKLKEKSFKNLKPDLGDVVITYGEETPFNMIVHAVIENNSHQKPEFKSTMKKCIDNILRNTNDWVHVKTIAMPLFGARQGLLTEKSWAELFLDRFLAFYQEVKVLNLEEVHIIVYFVSSGAYSTLQKVFCDSADQLVKAQPQKFFPSRPPLPNVTGTSSDDMKDPLLNRGNGSVDKGEENDNCTVCICPKTDPKSLSCGHSFCSECIDEMFKHKPVCPICGKIVGTLTGDQPKNGKMYVTTSSLDLAGYEGHGSIVITYNFPAGRQGPNHPSPGASYGPMIRVAYLPNMPEGTKVCRMLQLAFDRRLVFTISQSRTTGKEGLTWNDIHHKTNPNPGTQFGYPDAEYLSRVKDELAAKGITETDVQTYRG